MKAKMSIAWVRLGCWGALLAVSAVAAGCADGQNKQMSASGQDQARAVVVADVMLAEATVDAVDSQKRTITLAGMDGKPKTFTVSPDVRNFDQIKKGDTVKAEYYEQIAISLRKANTPPEAADVAAVDIAPKGQKPGIVGVNVFEITANVQTVDAPHRTITLRGPEGNLITLKVDKRVKDFDKVRPGEQFTVRVTDAVAITVVKP